MDLSRARVPADELAVFTREIAAMHAAGISLLRAFDFYAQSTTSDLGRVCADVVSRMKGGASLSWSLRQHPRVFSDVFVSLVEAGEHSGELRDILEKLADLQERNRKLRQRVVSTLTYPCILLAACALSLGFFIFVILPAMLPLFASLNVQLPLITWALASLGAQLRKPWVWGLIGVAGLAGLPLLRGFARRLRAHDATRRMIEGFILRVPVAGQVVEKVVAARMMYTVSTLMQAGVFLETALLKAGDVAGVDVITARMEGAVDDIHNGDTMTAALARHRVFPRAVLQIIGASEGTGKLVMSLQRATVLFEEDVETSLTAFSALIEPVILVGMGIVSGFIVLSVIIPTVRLLEHL